MLLNFCLIKILNFYQKLSPKKIDFNSFKLLKNLKLSAIYNLKEFLCPFFLPKNYDVFYYRYRWKYVKKGFFLLFFKNNGLR